MTLTEWSSLPNTITPNRRYLHRPGHKCRTHTVHPAHGAVTATPRQPLPSGSVLHSSSDNPPSHKHNPLPASRAPGSTSRSHRGLAQEHVRRFRIGCCKHRSICTCLRSNTAHRRVPTSDRSHHLSSRCDTTGVFLLPCCQRQNRNGLVRGSTLNHLPAPLPREGWDGCRGRSALRRLGGETEPRLSFISRPWAKFYRREAVAPRSPGRNIPCPMAQRPIPLQSSSPASHPASRPTSHPQGCRTAALDHRRGPSTAWQRANVVEQKGSREEKSRS